MNTRTSFLLIIFSILYMLGFTQSGEVIYHQTVDLVNTNEYQGKTKLRFNLNEAIYSQLEIPEKQGLQEEGMVFHYVVKDKEGFPIYLDYKHHKFVQRTTYGGRIKCVYRDSLAFIDWKLMDSVRQIGSFQCFLASGTFGGRTYQAWYAPSIPVQAGPHKLWGLPGLILEAYSTDGKVSFIFSEIKINSQKLNLVKPFEKETFESAEALKKADYDYEQKVIMKLKALGAEVYQTPNSECCIEKDL